MGNPSPSRSLFQPMTCYTALIPRPPVPSSWSPVPTSFWKQSYARCQLARSRFWPLRTEPKAESSSVCMMISNTPYRLSSFLTPSPISVGSPSLGWPSSMGLGPKKRGILHRRYFPESIDPVRDYPQYCGHSLSPFGSLVCRSVDPVAGMDLCFLSGSTSLSAS